jgi:hypothetical protein
MAFKFDQIESVEFGVCIDTEDGESYRLVPIDDSVKEALREMLAATMAALSAEGAKIEEFSPAEKYASNERLSVSLESDLVEKHREIFAAENLATDTDALNEPTDLVSYFAIFRDSTNAKLMAFKRATQFKGVIKKHLITIIDDSLHIVPDQLFKLDNDFDFLIFDNQILIWHPIGFIFTADMDAQIAECAATNVDSIAEDITCVDFTGLKTFVSKHKLAMRLVAALKSRSDLVSVSKTRLRAECRESGVKVIQKDGKLSPAEGSEMGFLMLLDRRRYTVTLIEKQPETYEAPSRHAATRAD